MLVEIRIDVFNRKSAAYQQVLHLEAEQVAHRKGMQQALLPPIRVGDIIDQLYMIDLVEIVP